MRRTSAARPRRRNPDRPWPRRNVKTRRDCRRARRRACPCPRAVISPPSQARWVNRKAARRGIARAQGGGEAGQRNAADAQSARNEGSNRRRRREHAVGRGDGSAFCAPPLAIFSRQCPCTVSGRPLSVLMSASPMRASPAVIRWNIAAASSRDQRARKQLGRLRPGSGCNPSTTMSLKAIFPPSPSSSVAWGMARSAASEGAADRPSPRLRPRTRKAARKNCGMSCLIHAVSVDLPDLPRSGPFDATLPPPNPCLGEICMSNVWREVGIRGADHYFSRRIGMLELPNGGCGHTRGGEGRAGGRVDRFG